MSQKLICKKLGFGLILKLLAIMQSQSFKKIKSCKKAEITSIFSLGRLRYNNFYKTEGMNLWGKKKKERGLFFFFR